jgi:hypothetical protein
MSAKELYTTLLTARMDAGQQMIHQMDEAILECIAAEQKLKTMSLIGGSNELLRRRLKLVLCEQAAKQFNQIKPSEVSGSETEQLQKLADAVGCPKITAWLERPGNSASTVSYLVLGGNRPGNSDSTVNYDEGARSVLVGTARRG